MVSINITSKTQLGRTLHVQKRVEMLESRHVSGTCHAYRLHHNQVDCRLIPDQTVISLKLAHGSAVEKPSDFGALNFRGIDPHNYNIALQ